MNQTVTLQKDNGIATICFNRPEAMNTYNIAMSETLLEITEELLYDNTTRVVLIKGDGPVFMAGGDIHYFREHLDSMPAGVRDIIRRLASTIHNIRAIKQPVIAAVHGAVAGAGLSLMLAADMVVGMEGTKLTAAYSALGISPDGGMSYFLPRHVGTKKAMELMLLSEQFSAEEAKNWGLLNKVYAPLSFEEGVATLIKKCMAMPEQALRHIKRLTYLSETQALSTQLESEGDSFVELTQTTDFKERVTGFLNK